MTFSRPNLTLFAVHLAGNAMLFLLGYYWLGVGESRTLTLAWSFLVALVAVSFAVLLHGATFAYYSHDVTGVPPAFRLALRHLPALLAAALVVFVLYVLLARWVDYSSELAFRIASWLTLKFRKPVKPVSVQRVFGILNWILRWVVVPIPLLPMIAGVSRHGWRGFARFGRLSGRAFWLQAPVLLLGCFWIPFLMIGWVPQVGSFTMEIISFATRFLVAYLLFVSCWLLLIFLTSSGRPVRSQPRTAVSP